MADFQNKYKGLVARINQRRSEELYSLIRLQESYKQLIGHEDAMISEKIKAVNSTYDSRIRLLEEFNGLMALSDDKLRILNSNERVDFDSNEVYSEAPELRDKIKSRSGAAEYLGFRFPFKEAETYGGKKVPRVTVREKLKSYGIGNKIPSRVSNFLNMILDGEGNVFKRKVDMAVYYLNKHVDRVDYRGNLLDLSEEELFGLEKRLRDSASDPLRRDEQVSPFKTQQASIQPTSELNQLLYDNMTKIIEYHQSLAPNQSRIVLDRLDLPRVVMEIRTLKSEFEKHQAFTPKQRESATELIVDYVTRLQQTPSLKTHEIPVGEVGIKTLQSIASQL